jgi:uncharacterized protein (TIGR03437 family)
LADGSPAIEHASDYSVVSENNFIHLGETIIIYMTGLGGGTVSATPAVTIGGSNCAVLYAGPTPGFVGLDQINCRTSSQNFTGPMPAAPLQVVLPNPQTDPPDPNAIDSNLVLVWVFN